MSKLRLLLWDECNRACEGCCNKDWDLEELPKLEAFHTLSLYDEIILTGGEPMLYPQRVVATIMSMRAVGIKTPIYMYTANVEAIASIQYVLGHLDGLTLTLHEQRDVQFFNQLNTLMRHYPHVYYNHSLRLNVFKGVDVRGHDRGLWTVKDDIEWLKDCPLPEDEVFMRL